MDRGAELTVTPSRTAVVPARRPVPSTERRTVPPLPAAPLAGPGQSPAATRTPGTRAPGTGTPAVAARPCRCGHGRDAHEHFRPGSDCATCGCARYRRPLLARA